MTTKRENVPYTALPGAVLMGVEVSRCSSCGASEVAIPAIEQLNQVLATAVVAKEGRLNGGEIRFLRTFLDYSSGDFANLIGSSPSTVSRWEGDQQDIGHHADLLLRALVMLGHKVTAYPIAKFAEVGKEPEKALKLKKTAPPYVLKLQAKKWKPAELAAA